MGYVANIQNIIFRYYDSLHIPKVRWTDIIEIVILSFVVYRMLVWIKNTKAWVLLKGLIIILAFMMVAVILNMTTILWISRNVVTVSLTALVVILQPEIRRALEDLGRTSIIANILNFNSKIPQKGRISDESVDELVKASFAMGRVCTGALMVIERNVSLEECIKTGIEVDAKISSALLINVFEHNTPLHDGAVVFRRDRLVAATCYLPLSANQELSKDLGTRHRAAVGISEESDAMVIVVSEETGHVSVAMDGRLERNLDAGRLKERLLSIQDKPREEQKRRLWKGAS